MDGKPALEDFYAAERLRMVRIAMMLVDDLATAEDVVQDAFSGIVNAWYDLADQGAAQAYLRTCVVNRARSVLRRRRTARTYVPPFSPSLPGADDAAVLAEEHQQVIHALCSLPHRQREVLVLRYWSGLSDTEVSQSLGISKGTVKSSASRGPTALRTALLRFHHA